MIIHIFKADLTFHCVGMIRNIINYSNETHYFVLYIENLKDIQPYISLFEEKSFMNYCFCIPENKKLKWVYRLINLVKSKKIRYSDQTLIDIIHKNKKNPIIIHGNLLNSTLVSLLLIGRFHNVSWINWGNYITVPGTTWHFRTWKNDIIQTMTIRLYRKFHSIVTLLQDDEKKMKELGIKRVKTIPYISTIVKGTMTSEISDQSNKIHILLGNSCHNIPEYYQLLKLNSFQKNDKYFIECMLSYGYEDRVDEINEFIAYGENLYKGMFKAWRDIVDIDTYWDRFRAIDVFICGKETQTGLGAIYVSLILGKKLYLTGYNYNWITGLGFKIYHINDIEKQGHLDMPLSSEDKIKNLRLYEDLFENTKIAEEWDSWYKSLYNKVG